MSQVPSIFSSQLGRFVRRSRENELELQTVGSTQLERQIQALFGGTQVKNLPQPLQQIISQDRALGGGGGSGPLTLINPFTNDELSLDQQKAAANQMAIQQGANPPFPEVQQPREQDSVAEAARRAATGLQPLVRQGLLSQEFASGIVRAVALDNTLDVNEQSKLATDVKALSQQFKSGRVNEQQVATTMERLRNEHKNESLNLIPEWRELEGTEGQFQVAKNEAIKVKADSFGLPVGAFRFDEKSGAVVLDPEWFEIDLYNTKKATEAAKPALELSNEQRKSAGINLGLRTDIANKRFQANSKSDPNAAANMFAVELGVANTQYINELPGVEANAAAAGQLVPAQSTNQPQAPAAVQGLPPGVSLFGTFPDPQSLINANPPPGSYIVGGGILFRVRLDGQLEQVQ